MYQKKYQNSEIIRQIIKSNNAQRLEHALRTTPELLNIVARHGLRPIQQAIVQGSVNLVEILLEYGADIGVIKSDGSSLLHLAVLNSNLELVRLLLKAGCDPSLADERGETPLFLAVHLNDLKIAKDLLDSSADPLIRDANCCNVFHLCALGDKAQELILYLCDSVPNEIELEYALCASCLRSEFSTEQLASPIETAIVTKSVTALKVFLSFLSPEVINRRFRGLISHCIEVKTTIAVIEALVDAGYDYRRELASMDMEEIFGSEPPVDARIRPISLYLRELQTKVPSLFSLCRLKTLSQMQPKDRRSSEAIGELHLPLMVSQKLCIRF